MKRMLLVLTALSAIAACSAAAAPNAQVMAAAAPPAVIAPATELAGPPPAAPAVPVQRVAASTRMDCTILARPTSHGVAISAVLNAGDAVSGNYNLVITKSGASGSSDVQQGGGFNAGRGERVTLGQTELGLDRGDRFHAVLTLTDANGRVCRNELRS